MESKRSHTYGLWTALIVATLFAAVYIGALVLLSRAQKAVTTQTAELAGETKRETSMQVLKALLHDLSDHTTKLNAFFVSPEEAVTVIEDMEALSSIAGAPITVADVHIKDQNVETGEGTLSMNIAAHGSWRSMTHVLALLDTLPFQSNLSSATLTLVGADDEETGTQWSFQGLLTVSLRR